MNSLTSGKNRLIVLFAINFLMFIHTSKLAQGQATCTTPSNVANFGVDGDIKANTPVGIEGDDWFYSPAFPGTGIGVIGNSAATATPAISSAQFNTILQNATTPAGRNRTYQQRMSVPQLTQIGGHLLIDAFAARDNISPDSSAFLSSNKNGDNPTLWTVGTTSVPNKNDIIDVGGHLRRQSSTSVLSSSSANDLWMFAYVTKLSTSGDSYTDIEIYRTVPYIDPVSGHFTNTGPSATGGHTTFTFNSGAGIVSPGDIIICINYNSSGGVASVRIWCNINNLDGNGNGFAWFNAQPNRPFNFTGDFITGTGVNGYGYAEITSLSGAGCLVYSVLNPSNTSAGDWGNLTGSGADYDTNIQPGQLVNIAFNFTDFGLDFATISGPCYNVFGALWFKSRSSSSYSSELKDCSGPYTFANFSEVQANAGPDKQLDCTSGQVTLNGSSATPGAILTWTTPNGNIVSGGNTANPVVNQPGTYIITAANPNFGSCVASDTVIVSLNINPPTASAGSDMQITCSNASISLNGSSTLAGALYSWVAINDGNIVSGSNTASPVVNSAGCYVLTVTNPANGCSAIDTTCVSLNITTPTISGQNQTNIGCYSNCSGTASFTVSGSPGPYTYNWSTGATTQNATGLCAGNYTVTVTAGNGCTATNTFSITQPSAALSVSASVTQNVSCTGGSNGVIASSGNGGTAPYSYVWNNGATTATISGLTSGTYTVTVTDANGCTSVNSATVGQPASVVSASVSVSQNVSCFGGTNGAIDLTPSGGTLPYTYLWNNGTTTQDLNNVITGTYTVTITDGNGCTVSQSATITQPAAALSVTASMTQSVACFGGNTGAASATVSGGTAPYTYLWNNGSTSAAISSLSTGIYSVTVTDANGCTQNSNINITQPTAALSGTISATQAVSCFGGSNGSIDLTVSGGTTPYSYNWSNGSTSQDITNLSSGTYTVIITDSRGCTTSKTVTISQPAAALTASANATQNVSCFGGNNGVIDLTVNGGTAPYTYNWNTGATTQDLSGLSNGFYSATITDANGCITNAGANISQPVAALSASLNVSQNVSCFGGNNGAINATVTGGTAPYTYSWSNGSTSQNLTGLNIGTYTLTVTDINGCTNIKSINVSQPVAALSGSLVMNQAVSCFGGSNGSLNLTVNGGTSPYTYLWSNGATTQDISGVGTGTYTVTVTDAHGCSNLFFETVTQPSASLSATATTTSDISCFGGSNGSVTLTVNGGTAPYSYNWSTGATTQNLSGVSAGSYVVTITDINGCTTNVNAQVTQPAGALSASVNVTQNVSCFAGNNGSINLTVANGTSPYTFNWSNGATSEDISGLSTGTYTVTVTDANGCTNIQSATVSQPANALSVNSISTQNVSCFDGFNGLINLSVSGGTAPYNFIWSTGAVVQNLSGLGSGSYSVTVTDANGCTASTVLSISQPVAPLTSNISSSQNVSCFGGANGTLDLTVSGGTAPYNYSWSNGASTQDVTGLIAGSYTVTITDANGCTSNQNGVISQPSAALSTSFVINQQVSCFGGNNGSINLSVNGGTAPYSFNWSNGMTTEDINGLAAGSYTVTVTDANGCITNRTITITQPAAALSANASQSQAVSCNSGSDGQISLVVSGGTGPYTFVWSNGQTTQSINGLVAGNYSVTVTDANGCIANSNATITQPAFALSGSITTTSNISCFSGSNGSIDLTVAGGTGPYTFMWSNGSTTEDLSGLPAGNYTVTITDANGCTAQSGGVITQPAGSLAANLNVSQNVACYGGGNGSLDLTVTGGTAPYNYIWNTGATTEDLSGLAVGTYTVNITDANGCISSATGTISQPSAALSGGIVPTQNVSCFAGNDGALNLTVTGGTAPYSYVWSSGQTSQDINNLTNGNYTVTITDANGCTDIQTGTITQPAAALAASGVASANVSCFGGSNGQINLTVNGGTSPYSFVWSDGSTTEDISGLTVGTYTVTVTDVNGCNTTATINVSEPSAPVGITVDSAIPVSCFGGNDGVASITATGGTAPYSYLWNTGSVSSGVNGLSTGTYTVTVTDANACSATSTVTLSQPAAALNATISSTQDVNCFGGNDGSVNLNVSGGTSPYTYLWNTGATTQNIGGLSNGIYTVTVTDANNCVTSQNVTIQQPSAALDGQAVVTANISCFSGNNGSIDLTVTGGTAPYTYLWNTGASTEDVSGLGSGIYTVTITDVNGCTDVASATITQPAGSLAASLSVNQNVLCFGGNTGILDLTVNGGTAPYSFMWNTGATTEDLSGVSTGVYTVNITDANGCITSQSAFVNQPSAALNVQATSVQPVLCFAGSDGSIDISVTGGTTPYTYLWNTGAVSEDLNSLIAGTYTVTITDANGCSNTMTQTISEPAAALNTALAVTQDVQCNGGNDGAIATTVTGGTSPYYYSWSNGAQTSDITGLVSGWYQLLVTDANGCTYSDSVQVNQPSNALSSVVNSMQSVNCFGGNNGSIDLNVSGGTSPYTYVWSNGATTEDISGLTSGTYTVDIVDANGCTSTNSATITQPSAPLQATINGSTNVSCFGGDNGNVNLDVTGGTAPYVYLWSNGSTNEDLSNLSAGTYTVDITDANGCTTTTSISISQPAAALNPVANVTQQVNCFAGEDGAIDLTVTGGTPPYTYLWNNGETTEDITDLMAGTYVVIVTDANGCEETATAVINQPVAPLLALATITSNVYCNGGSNGAIDVTTNGGTAPYTFLWSNGETTEDISNLATGMYTVTITDANGCTTSVSAGIGQPAQQLGATVTIQDVLCFNGNNGTIDITPTGGTAPYFFNWSTGATTEDIGALVAGIYTVTISDANGCDTSITATVVQPANPLIPVLTINNNVSCFGGSDGSMNVVVSGGTLPYVYMWSNGQTSTTISGLPAGQYTLTVTDANGCNAIISDFVSQPAAPVNSTVSVSQNVSCFGGSNGSLITNTTGGTPPYSYVWNTGATTGFVNNLAAGTYTVTITDSKGCTFTASGFVDQPAFPLSVNGTSTIANCLYGIGGSITITPAGGTLPYSFAWSNGITTQNLTNTMPGNYTVTVTDANGCSIVDTYNIGNFSQIDLQTGPTVICAGDYTTLFVDSLAGASYQWYYNGSVLNGATSPSFTTPAGGFYYVSVITACGTFDSDSVEIQVKSIDDATISSNQIICPPEMVQLHATGGVTYDWTPSTFIISSSSPNPYVAPIVSTTYSVQITNEWGCKTTLSVDVAVACDTLIIPNGFSPNDDGTNDGYVIDGIENYPGNRLWVYNRWGNLIYKAKDYMNTWDGVANVSGIYMGKKVPTGTYFFILDLNDNSKPRSGYLIIRR